MGQNLAKSSFPAKFNEKYKLKKELQVKSDSVLYICRKFRNKKKLLVKVKNIDDEGVFRFNKAHIDMMKSLNHPSIMKTHDYFENDKSTFLVTEFCPNGDLHDHIVKQETSDIKMVRIFMRQILEALDYLHDRNLVHRDIKLENICLDKHNHVKLVDFDFCINDYDMLKKRDVRGTAMYCSPEKIDKLSLIDLSSSDKPADVWAAGITMYMLLTGRMPFSLDSDLYDNIQARPININNGKWKLNDCEAISLLKQMLAKTPGKRITVKQALRHDFFG